MFKHTAPFRALRISPAQLFYPTNRYLSTTSIKMAGRVVRVTMFKLPKEDDQKKMLEEYRILATKALKNGKPYILSMDIGVPEADPRSQGFTIVNKSEFASMEDMKYYDDECPAHQELKAFVKNLTLEGFTTVYFHPQITAGVQA